MDLRKPGSLKSGMFACRTGATGLLLLHAGDVARGIAAELAVDVAAKRKTSSRELRKVPKR